MGEEKPAIRSGRESRTVVGVDGSPSATRALEYAAYDAARRGAVLLVVCVYGRPPSGTTLTLTIGLLEDDAESLLRQALEHVGEITPEVVAKGDAVLGSPGRVLVQMSEPATSLVVGTRGHGHLTGMILGSVSEYAVHHAACATTVVR